MFWDRKEKGQEEKKDYEKSELRAGKKRTRNMKVEKSVKQELYVKGHISCL